MSLQQERIDTDIDEKGWSMTDKLYLKDPDPSYTNDIGRYFTPIDEYGDMANNATMLENTLQVGLLGLYLNYAE